MKILFDKRWLEFGPSDVSEVAEIAKRTADKVASFLSNEKVGDRIARAIERANVWARIEAFGDRDLPVHDVRVLHEGAFNQQNIFIETCQTVQVLIAEGWKQPSFVWTDEPDLEIIEGLQ
jgi:hypothetical protein